MGRLADLLIPPASNMPGGSDAQANGEYLDRVFEVRPDLVETIRSGLTHVPDPLPATFEQIDPATFALLRPVADAVTAAYFINPEVARLVGYRQRSVIPIQFDEDLDALVGKVVARGPIYRPTPAREEH